MQEELITIGVAAKLTIDKKTGEIKECGIDIIPSETYRSHLLYNGEGDLTEGGFHAMLEVLTHGVIAAIKILDGKHLQKDFASMEKTINLLNRAFLDTNLEYQENAKETSDVAIPKV